MQDLPPNARAYLDALETLGGVAIALVSVGPERSQTIVRAERQSRSEERTVVSGPAA